MITFTLSGDVKKQRNSYFNIAKGMAICLIVMQHCFLYFDNGVFRHCMLNKISAVISVPLFMFVSGYFNSINKMSREIIRKRFISLVIPFLTWSYLYFLYENHFQISQSSILSFNENLITASYYPGPMWFLRILFLQILIVYGCSKLT